MTTVKRILTAIAIIFLVLFLVNAILAFIHTREADAATRCPGGTAHKTYTRYLADKRHQPLRLAQLTVKARACFTQKGHIKSARAKIVDLHRNGTAETLGYRYEKRPGLNTRKGSRLYGPGAPTNKVVGVTWRLYGSYRQCIPGVPGGTVTCGPDGVFHVTVKLWSDWMVKHDPYGGVKGKRNFRVPGIYADSWYAREFMIYYKTP